MDDFMAPDWRDLDSLSRHTQGISLSDGLRFLLAYTDQARFSSTLRALWRQLEKRRSQLQSRKTGRAIDHV